MTRWLPVIHIQNGTEPVQITDDDTTLLTLESSPEPVQKGSDVTLTARLSNPMEDKFKLHWWVEAAVTQSTVSARYTDLADVNLLTTGSLTFASNQTAGTFTIATTDDTLVEDDETFVVFLQAAGTVHGLDHGTVRTNCRTVTIADSDTATVSVAPTSITVAEPEHRLSIEYWMRF